MSTLKVIETAWLAGLLEGEGYFGWGQTSGGGTPRVEITMTDLDVIDRARPLMKVTAQTRVMVDKRDRYKSEPKVAYRLTVQGQNAYDVMSAILPFMGERRKTKILELMAKFEDKQNARSN